MNSAELVQWVGAGASVFAGVVALVIPFLMQRMQQKRDEEEERDAVKEVCVTITGIVRMYVELFDKTQPGKPNQSFTRYRQISAESQAAGAALERMLAQAGWTDGLHIAGSAAIVLADGIAEAGRDAGNSLLDEAQQTLLPLHHVAQLANSRCERVRDYFAIVRSETDPIVIV